jgi:transposase-like protein
VLVDDGARPEVSTVQRSRIAALERENRELRRANAILKAAALKSTRQRNVTMIQAEVLHGEDWETGVG